MITGIGHVAIRVSDLKAALAFYQGVLGLPELFRLNHDDGSPWLVYLKVNADNFVELFPGGVTRAEAQGNPVGYVHLCLHVDDMTKTLAELAKRGVDTSKGPTKGKDGNWQFWLTDPDGNRIELMQLMPDGLQRKAVAR
jgi:lactoylglutathione lyase